MRSIFGVAITSALLALGASACAGSAGHGDGEVQPGGETADAPPMRAASAGSLERQAPHPRLLTIAALERAAAGRGTWLDASLAEGRDGDTVRVGEEISYRFAADRDAYLTVVHVDGEGNLELILQGDGGRLAAGRPLLYEGLGVVLPIGSEAVYAFGTSRPLRFEQLGIWDEKGGHAAIDPVVGPEFARCLASHLDRFGDDVASAQLDYRVREKADELPYTTRSIEEYFTMTTRSFRRPTLDLLIHFESGKAELRPPARDRLDEVGRALAGSRIGTYRFVLNGHTDDVGTDAYNLGLSKRRADAAMQYLVSKYGVDPARLEVVAYGEASPKVPGTTPSAREQNRRVELEFENLGVRGNYKCGA